MTAPSRIAPDPGSSRCATPILFGLKIAGSLAETSIASWDFWQRFCGIAALAFKIRFRLQWNGRFALLLAF